MVGRDDVIALLESRAIAFESVLHKAVFSIPEMEEAGVMHGDRIAKNLFLRDDRKRAYYLVSIRNDRTADLKELRRMLGSRPLSFASEDDLHLLLGLAHCGNDFVLDEGANLLYLFVAEHYCAYHLFVGNFVGARLYH